MTDTEEDLLISGAVVVGGFYLVKTIGKWFGYDPEEQQAVQDQQNLPPAENPFTLQYQPFLDEFNSTNANGRDASGNIVTYDLSTWMQQARAIYAGDASFDFENTTFAMAWQSSASNPQSELYAQMVVFCGELLNSAWGLLGPQWEPVNYVISRLACKIDLSYVAAYVNVNYGLDLLDYLFTGGSWALKGLSADNMMSVLNTVKALPENY